MTKSPISKQFFKIMSIYIHNGKIYINQTSSWWVQFYLIGFRKYWWENKRRRSCHFFFFSLSSSYRNFQEILLCDKETISIEDVKFF